MGWLLLPIAAVWVACAVINFGLMFAYFQGKFELIADETYWWDVLFCGLASALGPLALPVTLLMGMTGYGFKYR